jgi:hypothetical protein
MNTDGTDNDGRLEPRTTSTAAGRFSQESVFGDAQWVAEHVEWIKRHYQRDNGNSEAAA